MKKPLKALVVDDEPAISAFVAEVLRSDNWEVSEVGSAERAFEAMSADKFALVFSDVMLGGPNGYEVLKRFSEQQPDARFVLMTGHASAAGALDATAIGAFDYLVKPFSVNDILRISTAIREQLRVRDKHSRAGRDVVAEGYSSDIPLIGKSPKFVECLKLVGRVAPTNLSVLISGDSGTGKEIVASAIHRRSRRAAGPFVTVNCGAVPIDLIESELFGHTRGSFTGASGERMGLWEEANGGTIFLDEITETSPQFQVKVLRALQEGEIRRVGSNRTVTLDVRVIGATNRDIETEVAEGRFRQDLMFRLNAVSIHLPSLCDRIEDIPLLAAHFASLVPRPGGASASFSAEAIAVLEGYGWPGNVRELENAVLHAVSLADDVVYPEHLPSRIRQLSGSRSIVLPSDQILSEGGSKSVNTDTGGYATLAEIEARYVAEVLEHTGGNKQAAARILNIDRKTLSRILSRVEQNA
ncbi:MAG TPA: sigma-54 dependent transcriptional regulator [Pyrinomonadaceae bacterium]|nr:sigma-54 dependent transcriptional regulator [Pyrinomonadaceae bacterium]